MKLNDDLYLIKLPMSFGGQERELNVSLILDPVHGATLVDTGLPGQEQAILAQAAAAGVPPSGITQILLTHQDVDHIGSAFDLKQLTGAKILALAEEAPYINGSKPSQKAPPPERLEQMPEFKALLESLKHVEVDELLTDGQELDIAGGVRVVATPGHTVGHLSLYLERSKVLITADALVSDGGTLHGPMEQATPDMASARSSVQKLAELDVDTIVCYHGGVVNEDANGQLQRVASQG